jgi:putative transcriptional regulator
LLYESIACFHQPGAAFMFCGSRGNQIPYSRVLPERFVMRAGKVRNNIRRLRFEAEEMTQQELADETGVTRQTIIAIEAARYAPSLELAFRIAEAFGKPLEEVFFYENGKA